MTMSKPTWIGAVGGHDVERWTQLAAGEKWMACYYGDHGQNHAIFLKPIPAVTTECTVTYPKKRGGGIQIMCKWGTAVMADDFTSLRRGRKSSGQS